MKETFLDTPEDCLWLRHGALKGLTVRSFDSFVIFGNEDSPERIELYSLQSPTIHDTPIHVFELGSDGNYVPAHTVTLTLKANVLAEIIEAASHGIEEMWRDVQGLSKDGENTDEQEADAERWTKALEQLEKAHGISI